MSADFVQNTQFSPPLGSVLFGERNDSPGALAGTNNYVAALQLDSAGALRVNQEGGKPTYFATSSFSCDSTATDIAVFAGVAGVTAKILAILITTDATSAAGGDLQIIRRKTANTAGTTANASVGLADMRDAAASCQPVHYTAHPTALGTGNGNIWAQRVYQPAIHTALPTLLSLDFTKIGGGKTLRVSGTSDFICVNVPAALGGSGNNWDVTWLWVEEPTSA
jgi:hypothetical protein